MKKILIALLLVLLSGTMLRAQGYRADTTKVSRVDSTLVGRNVLSVLGSGVTVNQSSALRSALERYVQNNASKKLTGYRIRVFYDNGQTARTRSESIARAVSNAYPGIGVYRTFESPNFKVMVGDFRTKDEALKVYQSLKATYPTALLLKDTINYPR
ncbi:MAG: hypothetical protein IJ156_07285 [Bacteroidales bacterium]|nr:hypothetical protein [Bacteroidales bacterium]